MHCHHQIAVLCFILREVIYFGFLFCAVLWSLSMGEAAVAIPPDVLEAAHPAAIPLPEHPASVESPALPTEEVVCSFAFSLVCCSLHMLCVLCRIKAGHGCFGNIHHLFCSSRSICLLSCFFLWRVVLACKVAFLAYIVFLMVFSFWPYVLSKLVFMGSAAFKFPFYSVCRFLTRSHGGYYS